LEPSTSLIKRRESFAASLVYLAQPATVITLSIYYSVCANK